MMMMMDEDGWIGASGGAQCASA